MINRDVFQKDPVVLQLPNNGVANVNDDASLQSLQVLRYELETFVCDGQYAEGLKHILDQYLAGVNHNQQPGVWVSGFFGSGKSHLVKMLRALWVNTRFSDGATARGLADLPQGIQDQLKDLSAAGKRNGGLYAVSGTLGSGSSLSVRIALLQIIFKSMGLPTSYPVARFVMRLKREGIYEQVVSYLQEHECDPDEEFAYLYASEDLHKALVAVKPQEYVSTEMCAVSLNNLYPNVADISNEEMIQTIRDALSKEGKFPLTLIILDEVQQFVGNDLNRSNAVQESVEAVSKQMGGKVLFIGTGQTAITGMSNLKKLEGRFTVRVELSEADVDSVIRKVILAKKPDIKETINSVMQKNLGEISRHLSGTAFAATKQDEDYLVADYPILPVRKRFWETSLRILDQTGTDSQLRNQLSMIHKVVQKYADSPLGYVVPADFLYFDTAERLLQARIVPSNIYKAIQTGIHGNDDERLIARAYALIFLINKIEHKQPDLGLTADINTLADLLVEDLEAGSSSLRGKLPDLLERSKLVMKINDTYRLQTEESSAWNDDFQNQLLLLANETTHEEARRNKMIKEAVNRSVEKVALFHGKNKVTRDLLLYYGIKESENLHNRLNVWVRDGWRIDEGSVRADAREAGIESPAIFVYIPNVSQTTFTKHLRDFIASGNVLNTRGMPSSNDAVEARSAMDTVNKQAKIELEVLLQQMISQSKVYSGGGTEVVGDNFIMSLKEAGEASLDRLYSKFSIGDDLGWDKVYNQAHKGAPDALKNIGYDGEDEKHPVCKLLLSRISNDTSGFEIRKYFEDSAYGWPRDTIDGAMQVLLVSGKITAKIGKDPVSDPKMLSRKDIGRTVFTIEMVRLSGTEKLAIRKVYQKVGVKANSSELAAHMSEFLHILTEMAAFAGDQPPFPDNPEVEVIDSIRRRTGNAQLKVIADNHEEITATVEEWKEYKDQIHDVKPLWYSLTQLAKEAKGLEEADIILEQVAFIKEHRKALEEKETIQTLITTLTQTLREQINEIFNTFREKYEAGIKELNEESQWEQLDPNQKYLILNDLLLRYDQQPVYDLSSTETLLNSIQETDLSTLKDRLYALPSRLSQAHHKAAQLLEPKARMVIISKKTVKSPEEVEQWIDETKKKLLEELVKGPVIIG